MYIKHTTRFLLTKYYLMGR